MQSNYSEHIVESNSISHQHLVANLTDEQRAVLTAKSDIPGLFHFASQLGVFLFSSYWIVSGLPGWQLAIVLQGILLVFLFTLLHETCHFTAYRSRFLNLGIGWLCALVIFLPPTWFRYFHLAHHRHTNDPDHDPELAEAKPQTIPGFLWAVTGIPVWWFHLSTIFRNAFADFDYPYLPERRKAEIKIESRIMILIYFAVFSGAIYFSWTNVFWLWLLPVFVGQPFLRLYLMAEHGRCAHVANMLENTRTTYTTSVVRWLAWNMPYHTEHHVYPAVPFHKLPKFHEVAKEHLRVTANGYTDFHKETIGVLSRGAD